MSKVSNRQLAKTVLQSLENGQTTASVVEQLAAYLVLQRRTKDAEAVIRSISDQLVLDRGHVELQVTTAQELSAELAKQIKQLFAGEGREIEINHTKDSSVIGGVLVELPGKRLDLTVRRRLQRLKQMGVK